MPLCGALLTLTKLSTSFIVNLGFSLSDLAHSVDGKLEQAAILDVCVDNLAFNQRCAPEARKERISFRFILFRKLVTLVQVVISDSPISYSGFRITDLRQTLSTYNSVTYV